MKGNLKVHIIRVKHEGICEWRASYASQVKTHKLDKHYRIKSKCDECNWRTNTKGKLRNHINFQGQELDFDSEYTANFKHYCCEYFRREKNT